MYYNHNLLKAKARVLFVCVHRTIIAASSLPKWGICLLVYYTRTILSISSLKFQHSALPKPSWFDLLQSKIILTQLSSPLGDDKSLKSARQALIHPSRRHSSLNTKNSSPPRKCMYANSSRFSDLSLSLSPRASTEYSAKAAKRRNPRLVTCQRYKTAFYIYTCIIYAIVVYTWEGRWKKSGARLIVRKTEIDRGGEQRCASSIIRPFSARVFNCISSRERDGHLWRLRDNGTSSCGIGAILDPEPLSYVARDDDDDDDGL